MYPLNANIKVGDKVQKKHPYDGTKNAGKALPEEFTVERIEDNHPIDGMCEVRALVYLSDGSCFYRWNLIITKENQND